MQQNVIIIAAKVEAINKIVRKWLYLRWGITIFLPLCLQCVSAVYRPLLGN